MRAFVLRAGARVRVRSVTDRSLMTMEGECERTRLGI
jgi:hypothetical protein